MTKQTSEFKAWMRSGRTAEGRTAAIEVKFNPNHDPKNGQFTSAGRGTSSGGRNAPAKTGNPEWRKGGRMSPRAVESRAANAMRMYEIHRARGMTPEQAAGWAATAEGESGGNGHNPQPGGPGDGLFQWGDGHREKLFEKLYGHPIAKSTENEQLGFRDWELTHRETGAAKKIAKAKTAGDIAAAITMHYERPKHKFRDAADRANIAEAILHRVKKGH